VPHLNDFEAQQFKFNEFSFWWRLSCSDLLQKVIRDFLSTINKAFTRLLPLVGVAEALADVFGTDIHLVHSNNCQSMREHTANAAISKPANP
jgi:hypothetical protein